MHRLTNMAESYANPAHDLPLAERRRRLSEADAAALAAEQQGDAAAAVAHWSAALDELGLIPDSLKVSRQVALFGRPEADLYLALLAEGPGEDALRWFAAHFRRSNLTAEYPHAVVCAAFHEILSAEELGRGAACLWRELLAKSPDACEIALQLRPQDPEVACASAKHMIDANQWGTARTTLRELLAAAPRSDDALALLRTVEARVLGDDEFLRSRIDMADRLIDLGACESAMRELAAAQRRAPDARGLLVRRAACLAELGRLDEALAQAHAAADAEPESADAQLALGEVLRRLGRLDEAAAALDRCAALAGEGDPLALQAREIAASVYAEIAERAFLGGKTGEATRAFQAALERDPAHGAAQQRMARLAELCGDYHAASAMWKRSAEAGHDEHAWRWRVCELLADGSDDALLCAAERCAQNGQVRWAERILLQVENAQLREQHPLFESVPTAVAELDDVCGRAWELLGSGEHARARDLFEKIRPVCPGDQRILRGLGFALAAEAARAYGSARDELVAAARQALEEAIAVDPTTEEAGVARERIADL